MLDKYGSTVCTPKFQIPEQFSWQQSVKRALFLMWRSDSASSQR